MMPNETLFLQMAVYLLLLLILYFTFFKPILAVLAERRRRTEGELERADANLKEFEIVAARYAEKMEAVRRELFSEKARRLREVERESEKIRGYGKKRIEESRVRIQREIESEALTFRVELGKTKALLKDEIVRRIMGE